MVESRQPTDRVRKGKTTKVIWPASGPGTARRTVNAKTVCGIAIAVGIKRFKLQLESRQPTDRVNKGKATRARWLTSGPGTARQTANTTMYVA